VTKLPRFVRDLISPLAIIVYFAGFVYSLVGRNGGPSSGSGTSAWALADSVIISPQFLAYIVVPAWFAFALWSSGRTLSSSVSLRYGSRARSLWAEAGHGAAAYACVALVLIIVLLLPVAGLPPSSVVKLETVTGEFLSIDAALLGAGEIVLLFLSLLTVRVIMVAIAQLCRRRWVPIVIAFAAWLWIVASTLGVVQTGTLTNTETFTNVVSLLGQPRLVPQVLCVLSSLILLSVLICVDADHRVGGLGGGISQSTIVLLSAAPIVFLAIAPTNPHHASYFNSVSIAFAGASAGLAKALVQASIAFVFAYQLQLRLTEAGATFRNAELIRFGSAPRLLRRSLIREMGIGAVYFASVCVWTLFVYLLLGGVSFQPPVNGLGEWSQQFLLNGVLQVLLSVAVVETVRELGGGHVVGAAFIGVLLVVSCVPVPPGSWYPFGSGGMARATFGWVSVYRASAGATACLLIAIGISYVVSLLKNPKLGKVSI
jgi:hypothetical protein